MEIQMKGRKLPRTAKAKTERAEQMALVSWARLRDIPLVHNCNEGKRTPREGANLKRMGLSPGYPDLTLDQARGGYFGLRIEFKLDKQYSPSEMMTPSWQAQSEWLTRLNNEHYFAVRCYGFERAKATIEKYLSWPKTHFAPKYQFVDYNVECETFDDYVKEFG